MNADTSNFKPTLRDSLTPSGANSASAGGAFLSWLFVVICDKKFGVQFPAGQEVMIGAGGAVVAGYLHEFFGLLLNKLRT